MVDTFIAKIFAAFEQENPHPKGELHYTNIYTLVVAVALSAQATDIGVNKATLGLFAIINTPQDMLDLGEERLIEYIKSIGLYKSKARNIMACAQILVDKFDGDVPDSEEDLVTLPGVGRKTANVVRNMGFGYDCLAVDTHVFRLAHRLQWSNGTTPDKVEADLLQIIPPQYLHHAHHWLILHGRYVCKARKPLCESCLISAFCPSKSEINPESR